PATNAGCPPRRSSCSSAASRRAPSGSGACAGSSASSSSAEASNSLNSFSSSSSAFSAAAGRPVCDAFAIGPRRPESRGNGASNVASSTASEGISPTRTCPSSASRARRCRSASSSPRRSRYAATGGNRILSAPTSRSSSKERREVPERSNFRTSSRTRGGAQRGISWTGVLLAASEDVVVPDEQVLRKVLQLVERIGAEGGDLDDLASAEEDVRKPEPPAEQPRVAERLLDLVGVRAGRDVEVLGTDSQQQ